MKDKMPLAARMRPETLKSLSVNSISLVKQIIIPRY